MFLVYPFVCYPMPDGDEERKKLEELNRAISKIRGEASTNLEYGFTNDWQTFMSKMMLLTTQSQSPRIQNYIFKKKGWVKVPAPKP